MIKLNKTFFFVVLLFSTFIILFITVNIQRTLSTGIQEVLSHGHGFYDCKLSRMESDEFFCEADEDWNRRKELFYLQHNRNRFLNSEWMFFQDNYEPTFSCRFEQRLGINGDGGKWICDPYQLQNSKPCLIYSLGSNGEFSFENETKRYFPNCEIHTFDMKVFNCTEMCTFHQVRIGNGSAETKTLRMIMSELNHINRPIDILKVDVEGSEYEFFDDLFNTNDYLTQHIRQILVEIHLGAVKRKVGNHTVVDYAKIHRLFDLFHRYHFVLFHKEVNLYNPHSAFEFSFIKLNEKFFQINNNLTSTQRP